MPEQHTFATPIGPLCLRASADGERLERVDFSDAATDPHRPKPAALRAAVEQLEAYFAGRLREFDLPLALHGTPFQLAVWQEIARTGFGRTRSYRELAIAIGRPRSARPTGQAVGRNPLSIIIPCHRIVGTHGALVGYGGGLKNKRHLLALEKSGRA